MQRVPQKKLSQFFNVAEVILQQKIVIEDQKCIFLKLYKDENNFKNLQNYIFLFFKCLLSAFLELPSMS